MKKKVQKYLCLLTVVSLAISGIPFSVSAQEPEAVKKETTERVRSAASPLAGEIGRAHV